MPRFHITWGTGPGLVDIFARRVLAAVDRGQVRIAYRHQVDELVVDQVPPWVCGDGVGAFDGRARYRIIADRVGGV